MPPVTNERAMTMRVITSVQRKAISEFFDQMRDTAQRNFEGDGACEPVAVFLRDEEPALLPLRQFINSKPLASAIINKGIEAIQPLALVLVVEAWMATAATDARTGGAAENLEKKYEGHLTEPAAGGKERPKAGVKEVVMLQCSSVAGDNFMLTADIVRTDGAKPRLNPWARTETAEARGQFVFNVTPLSERQ